ncbi:MAG: NADH-quinone oxidoreductase subunit NuoK [Actinobacteria bacterium HGW-Actinobacteria-7]|jgi:NADH-quinone oxidoreductase subunit K|nr:MAG: NADH-quinone oxidoreductase subunit NuoK [Actinobacteria bacterium HGW-Actinobacteria-7]
MSSLVVSIALFCIGLYAVLTRKEVIAILVGVEVMIAGALLVLVMLGSHAANGASIHAVALLILVLAATEAAVGLGLLVAAARRLSTTCVDEMTEVRG